MQPDQSQDDHKQPATGEPSVTPPVEPTSAEVADQTSDENQQAPQKRLLEGLRSRINWLTLLNVVVGLSTIIQAFYTYKGLQFTAAANQMTRDSVELTRQQLALTRELERAHVVIQDVGPLPLIDKQRVPITLKNIGRAAATDVQVWTAHNSMGEAPLSKDTGLQCVWMTKHMVTNALGADQATTYYTPEIEVLRSTAQQMQSGKGRLFLWVSIHYADILGTRPGPPSCFAWTGDPRGNWRPCDTNDYRDRIDPKTAVCK